jgi:hypothetical protein
MSLRLGYENIDRVATAEPKFKPPKQTMSQEIRDLLHLKVEL